MDASQNTQTTAGNCRCGCEQPVSSRSLYRQGHDAKHVSNLLAATKEVAHTEHDISGFEEFVRTATAKLPTDRLQAKYTSAVTRWLYSQFDRDANQDRRSDGHHAYWFSFHPDDVLQHMGWEAPAGCDTDPSVTPADDIKVGRWTYPARRFDGVLQRNTRRDGSGDWVEVA